jgi:hypothetical protein
MLETNKNTRKSEKNKKRGSDKNKIKEGVKNN